MAFAACVSTLSAALGFPYSAVSGERTKAVRAVSTFVRTVMAISSLALFAAMPANAQSNQNSGFGVGNVHKGLVVGVAVGVAAAAGIGITYLVIHTRGVVVGCIAESGGKRTLQSSDRRVYTLSDSSPPLPVGERLKLKGRKSGPASSPSFQVEKVVKDYGHCQP
jgi:hypothetical protein